MVCRLSWQIILLIKCFKREQLRLLHDHACWLTHRTFVSVFLFMNDWIGGTIRIINRKLRAGELIAVE